MLPPLQLQPRIFSHQISSISAVARSPRRSQPPKDPDDRLRGSAARISFCDSELVSIPGKGHLGKRATGLRMVRRISQAVQVADRSLKRTEPVRQKRDGPRLLFDAGPKPEARSHVAVMHILSTGQRQQTIDEA